MEDPVSPASHQSFMEELSPDGGRKGPWALEEDELLKVAVEQWGCKNWTLVAERSGLSRSGKSCRLRWHNHLSPSLKRGAFTTAEEAKIVYLHSQYGNKWARIARQVPGRTDNEIKNFWHTRARRLKKKAALEEAKRVVAALQASWDAAEESITGSTENTVAQVGQPQDPLAPERLQAQGIQTPASQEAAEERHEDGVPGTGLAPGITGHTVEPIEADWPGLTGSMEGGTGSFDTETATVRVEGTLMTDHLPAPGRRSVQVSLLRLPEASKLQPSRLPDHPPDKAGANTHEHASGAHSVPVDGPLPHSDRSDVQTDPSRFQVPASGYALQPMSRSGSSACPVPTGGVESGSLVKPVLVGPNPRAPSPSLLASHMLRLPTELQKRSRVAGGKQHQESSFQAGPNTRSHPVQHVMQAQQTMPLGMAPMNSQGRLQNGSVCTAVPTGSPAPQYEVAPHGQPLHVQVEGNSPGHARSLSGAMKPDAPNPVQLHHGLGDANVGPAQRASLPPPSPAFAKRRGSQGKWGSPGKGSPQSPAAVKPPGCGKRASPARSGRGATRASSAKGNKALDAWAEGVLRQAGLRMLSKSAASASLSTGGSVSVDSAAAARAHKVEPVGHRSRSQKAKGQQKAASAATTSVARVLVVNSTKVGTDLPAKALSSNSLQLQNSVEDQNPPLKSSSAISTHMEGQGGATVDGGTSPDFAASAVQTVCSAFNLPGEMEPSNTSSTGCLMPLSAGQGVADPFTEPRAISENGGVEVSSKLDPQLCGGLTTPCANSGPITLSSCQTNSGEHPATAVPLYFYEGTKEEDIGDAFNVDSATAFAFLGSWNEGEGRENGASDKLIQQKESTDCVAHTSVPLRLLATREMSDFSFETAGELDHTAVSQPLGSLLELDEEDLALEKSASQPVPSAEGLAQIMDSFDAFLTGVSHHSADLGADLPQVAGLPSMKLVGSGNVGSAGTLHNADVHELPWESPSANKQDIFPEDPSMLDPDDASLFQLLAGGALGVLDGAAPAAVLNDADAASADMAPSALELAPIPSATNEIAGNIHGMDLGDTCASFPGNDTMLSFLLELQGEDRCQEQISSKASIPPPGSTHASPAEGEVGPVAQNTEELPTVDLPTALEDMGEKNSGPIEMPAEHPREFSPILEGTEGEGEAASGSSKATQTAGVPDLAVQMPARGIKGRARTFLQARGLFPSQSAPLDSQEEKITMGDKVSETPTRGFVWGRGTPTRSGIACSGSHEDSQPAMATPTGGSKFSSMWGKSPVVRSSRIIGERRSSGSGETYKGNKESPSLASPKLSSLWGKAAMSRHGEKTSFSSPNGNEHLKGQLLWDKVTPTSGSNPSHGSAEAKSASPAANSKSDVDGVRGKRGHEEQSPRKSFGWRYSPAVRPSSKAGLRVEDEGNGSSKRVNRSKSPATFLSYPFSKFHGGKGDPWQGKDHASSSGWEAPKQENAQPVVAHHVWKLGSTPKSFFSR